MSQLCIDHDNLTLQMQRDDITKASNVFQDDKEDDFESSTNALITDSDIIVLLESGICIESLVDTYPLLTKDYVIKLKNKSDKKNKRKKKKKKYDEIFVYDDDDQHENAAQLDEFMKRFKTFGKKTDFINKQKHKKNHKQQKNKQKYKKNQKERNKFCLIIVIADTDDTDMRIDAHKIILRAQETRGYQTYSMMFVSKQIKFAMKQNTFNQITREKLQIDQNIKSYFDKIIILGHCNYYTINNDDSYYNEPFLSHDPTLIDDRFICGLNIIAMSEFIKYIIKQLAVYNISLCCCESATKNVHLECEILDEWELTEDEQKIYDAVSEYRLKNNISVKPQFVNKNDEKDKHLFIAFKYEIKYAQLIDNLIRNGIKKNGINICNHSLSVLDLISHQLYEQNMLQILEKPLLINALNGFGYYRHPDMSIYEIDELKDKMMDILKEECDEKENNEIMSFIFNLDKEFSGGPLRNDCIYYSIKNRDGVQWLIDKDNNNLHKKRNWCQFELTQILDIDQQEIVNDDEESRYDEKYFVHRPHVIQYQFHPLSRKNN